MLMLLSSDSTLLTTPELRLDCDTDAEPGLRLREWEPRRDPEASEGALDGFISRRSRCDFGADVTVLVGGGGGGMMSAGPLLLGPPARMLAIEGKEGSFQLREAPAAPAGDTTGGPAPGELDAMEAAPAAARAEGAGP